MKLSIEDKAVLAHVVVDPDAWLAHAVEARGEEQAVKDLAAKVARWKPEYEKAKERFDYKTRVERDAEEEAARQPTPEQIAEQEKEALIQAKIREMAEAELVAENKLTVDGDLVIKK